MIIYKYIIKADTFILNRIRKVRVRTKKKVGVMGRQCNHFTNTTHGSNTSCVFGVMQSLFRVLPDAVLFTTKSYVPGNKYVFSMPGYRYKYVFSRHVAVNVSLGFTKMCGCIAVCVI